jgi:leucyl-tRNA---protein transferase
MKSLFSFTTPPHICSYLPEQVARLQYEVVASISADEYQRRLHEGWRHFGHSLFRPRCLNCTACQSIRVPVEQFRPNRSQKRALQANRDVIISIGTPSVSDEKLNLYDRFHDFQSGDKGWPEHLPKEESSYQESFVDNPVPTQEWRYTLDGRLIGVGYVDWLPQALSAIYFYYDPDERNRSLGTFNVLSVLAEAKRCGIPHLYLGYYVAGCRSLEYKANFLPNQVLGPNGDWVDFRG